MSLTDIMSNARLEWFAEVALVLFAAAFATIVIRTLLRRRSEIEYAARLPLDERNDAATGRHS
jgi:cbb3-type cytochrome oxidase subunit 3